MSTANTSDGTSTSWSVTYLSSLFQIREGEGRLTMLMLALSFFAGGAIVFFDTAANAIFIDELGAADYPVVYIAFAFLMVGVGYIFGKLRRHLPMRVLMIGAFAVILLVVLIFRIGLGFQQNGWLAFALLIWLRLMYVFFNLIFWLLANHLFSLQQGKRLFGLIASGAVWAQIIGFLSVPLIVRVVGTYNLLLISALNLAVAMVALFIILRWIASTETAAPPAEREPAQFRRTRELLKDQYISLSFAVVGLGSIVFYFISFGFYSQTDLYLQSTDQLASFFGLLFGLTASATLVTQTFLSSKLLRRFGVKVGLLVRPLVIGFLALLLGTMGLLPGSALAVFWLMVILTSADEITLASLYRPSLMLLYQPIPSASRQAAQTSLDTLVIPIAIGVSGAILLIFRGLLAQSFVVLAYSIAVLALVWSLLILLIARQYPQRILQALAKRRLRFAAPLLDRSSLVAVQSSLDSEEPSVVLHALRLTKEMDGNLAQAEMVRALEHPALEVRRYAAQEIGRTGSTYAVDAIQERLNVESEPRVRAALLQALVRQRASVGLDAAQSGLDDPEPLLRRAASICLLQHEQHPGHALAQSRLEMAVSADDPSERANAASVIGDVGRLEFEPQLAVLLADLEREVQRAALLAAGKIPDTHLWPVVINALTVRGSCQASMVALISAGDRVVPVIHAAWNEPGHPSVLRARLAHVLGEIGGLPATKYLAEHIDSEDIALRTQVLQALHRCHYTASDRDRDRVRSQIESEISLAKWFQLKLLALDFDGDCSPASSLLHRALAEAVEQVRHRVIHLLTFIYDRHAILRARENLRHPLPSRCAYAQEILSLLLDAQMRFLLMPLFEDLSPSECLGRWATVVSVLPGDRARHMQELVCEPSGRVSTWLRVCAQQAVPCLTSEELTTELLEALTYAQSSDEPLVRETAQLVLHDLLPSARQPHPENPTYAQADRLTLDPLQGGITMLSTLERVLFLRTVELFHDVPDDVLAWVAQAGQEVQFSAGEKFITEGDLGDALYIIIDGDVDIVLDQRGKVATRGAKSIIGEMAILTNLPRTASCIAVTGTAALKIARDDFLELVSDIPELALAIISGLVHRVDELSQKVAK